MSKYHLVCRDCEFERLKSSKTAAASARIRHEDETGHTVEDAEVSDE